MATTKPAKKLPKGLMDEIQDAVKILEKELGKNFGDNENPIARQRPLRCCCLDARG
ncbi:hypothetical protein [Rhodopirellula europaea]|uniref:hypothetical protein n=1 Tax=Rhodopirellula europaea TaxID=1263866 RepID=UPI003D2748F1